MILARGAGDSGNDNKNALMPLSAASRALNNFVDRSWGGAKRNPRIADPKSCRARGAGDSGCDNRNVVMPLSALRGL
ncbi:MAG: hypothetical protein ACR2H4_05375 [Pyrinomonadaceae bacterium]